MINVTIYMDGETTGIGYKFVVTRGCTAWTAYRTAKGFNRFMRAYGLKIDPATVQTHIMHHKGNARCMTAACFEKTVKDGEYFYSLDEVPEAAKQHIDLCNGEYVNCYILDEGDTVTMYRPNPNAQAVYIPYNYRECAAKFS